MESRISRRHFTAALAAGAGSVRVLFGRGLPGGAELDSRRDASAASGPHKRPVVIASANGYQFGATRVAYERLIAGADTLDAVIAGVNMNENDPNDMTVGYGALPNEDGAVSLDACVMHGPTNRCGAVGCLYRVKNAASFAKAIMDNTDEIFLAGEDATRLAQDFGFTLQSLETDRCRRVWLLWRETRSLRDSWGAGLDSPEYQKMQAEKANGPDLEKAMAQKAAELGIPEDERELAVSYVLKPPTGTINCLAVNEKGEISGATTTAGIAFKIAGRVGDSPIIGAGLYVDGRVGGAGSTGRGEENIRIAGGHTVVEMMRQGRTPTEACLEACRRVQANFAPYPDRLKKVDLQFYALRGDGAHGAASLWGPANGYHRQYAVHDGTNRLVDFAYLLSQPA